MSQSFTISQRSLKLNGLFAGIACAMSLTLAAGPALAQTATLERVEVGGKVIEAQARNDVRTACADIDGQLEGALNGIWAREGRNGEVAVQFVMQNGAIDAVTATGISQVVARSVRQAVSRLDCGPQLTADAQTYRFSVDFVGPNARAASPQTAGRKPGAVRI